MGPAKRVSPENNSARDFPNSFCKTRISIIILLSIFLAPNLELSYSSQVLRVPPLTWDCRQALWPPKVPDRREGPHRGGEVFLFFVDAPLLKAYLLGIDKKPLLKMIHNNWMLVCSFRPCFLHQNAVAMEVIRWTPGSCESPCLTDFFPRWYLPGRGGESMNVCMIFNLPIFSWKAEIFFSCFVPLFALFPLSPLDISWEI